MQVSVIDMPKVFGNFGFKITEDQTNPPEKRWAVAISEEGVIADWACVHAPTKHEAIRAAIVEITNIKNKLNVIDSILKTLHDVLPS